MKNIDQSSWLKAHGSKLGGSFYPERENRAAIDYVLCGRAPL
jgi:hypothetical protein